jgi:hypothetical protein
MSQQLPVPVRDQSRERALAVPAESRPVAASIARLAIALAPDVLRATERALLNRSRQEPAPRQEVSTQMHTHSVQLSEVQISTSLPFVRQVTVRNATSWTSFPAVEPEPEIEPAKRSRGRLLGISGAVALVAAVMVRRAMPSGKVIDVPGRQRGW